MTEKSYTARDALLAACDQSNWPDDAQQGEFFQGYSAAMDAVHEIILDFWGELGERGLQQEDPVACLVAQNEQAKNKIKRTPVAPGSRSDCDWRGPFETRARWHWHWPFLRFGLGRRCYKTNALGNTLDEWWEWQGS